MFEIMTELDLKYEIIRLKNEKGCTNQQLADLSGVPLGTVAGITSKNNARTPSYATAVRLMQALGQNVPMETLSEEPMKEDVEMELALYKSLLDETRENHKGEIARMVASHDKIMNNKEKWMNPLFWVCIVLGVLFVVVLVWAFKLDSMLPTFGLIQY